MQSTTDSYTNFQVGRNPDKTFTADKALGNCQQVREYCFPRSPCLCYWKSGMSFLSQVELEASSLCGRWHTGRILNLGCRLWACACESSGHPDTVHRLHLESLAWPAHTLLSYLHPVDSLISEARVYFSGSWSVISHLPEGRPECSERWGGWQEVSLERFMGTVCGIYRLAFRHFSLVCTSVFTTIFFIPWGWNQFLSLRVNSHSEESKYSLNESSEVRGES